jgi:hypothetical protein
MTLRVIAIDWSGALKGAENKIWLAEAVDGEIQRLECGRSREAIVEHLIEEAARDREIIVGLDFAFSMPAWFLRESGVASAPALWQRVAHDGEAWLAGCEPPFWGRTGRPRPSGLEIFRRTEMQTRRASGIGAKSVFQIGGAGAVGTGSLRGMPLLLRLRNAGFAIWPFFGDASPRVVEIYPRLLTGAVNKSQHEAREQHLIAHWPDLPAAVRDTAASSEDSFDAAESALRMWEHREELLSLRRTDDALDVVEGAIWQPTAAAVGMAPR